MSSAADAEREETDMASERQSDVEANTDDDREKPRTRPRARGAAANSDPRDAPSKRRKTAKKKAPAATESPQEEEETSATHGKGSDILDEKQAPVTTESPQEDEETSATPGKGCDTLDEKQAPVTTESPPKEDEETSATPGKQGDILDEQRGMLDVNRVDFAGLLAAAEAIEVLNAIACHRSSSAEANATSGDSSPKVANATTPGSPPPMGAAQQSAPTNPAVSLELVGTRYTELYKDHQEIAAKIHQVPNDPLRYSDEAREIITRADTLLDDATQTLAFYTEKEKNTPFWMLASTVESRKLKVQIGHVANLRALMAFEWERDHAAAVDLVNRSLDAFDAYHLVQQMFGNQRREGFAFATRPLVDFTTITGVVCLGLLAVLTAPGIGVGAGIGTGGGANANGDAKARAHDQARRYSGLITSLIFYTPIDGARLAAWPALVPPACTLCTEGADCRVTQALAQIQQRFLIANLYVGQAQ